MPDDSTSKPGKETRLLNLTERWARESERMSGYFDQTKDLLRGISESNLDLKARVMGLETACRELSALISTLKNQCKEAQKQKGVLGAFEWAMKAAKEQPLAFALVFVTTIMLLIMLALLGYKLNLQSLLGA